MLALVKLGRCLGASNPIIAPRACSRPAVLLKAFHGMTAQPVVQNRPHHAVHGPYSADAEEVAKACCEIIAQAMGESPSNAATCIRQDPALYYERWHAIAINTLLRSGSHKIIYTLDDGEQATLVAAWYPAQKVPEDAPEPLGIVDVSHLSRPDAMPQRNALLQSLKVHLEAFEKEHPSFLYIKFLCVRPGHQGQGLGSRLLSHVLEEADRRGLPAYLEATNEGNVALYKRHGFELQELQEFEYEWTPTKSSLYYMKRAANQVKPLL